jgi:hypothetical protein
MQRSEVEPALGALLGGAIDYAGLFPPAGLDLESAVARYGEYRTSLDRWALGRFVVPTHRLSELSSIIRAARPIGWDEARLSATLGSSLAEELSLVGRFNDECAGEGVRVDTVEAKVSDPVAIEALVVTAEALEVTGYVEVMPGAALEESLGKVAELGLLAKIRMGGVTADLFPEPELVAAFLLGAAGRGLSFKATAGLHHPRRGEYRLTYEPGSPRATMYGFLNLAVATLVSLDAPRGPPAPVVAALLDREPSGIRIESDRLVWRDRSFDLDAIARLRSRFHGFGSCSFREPIDELDQVGDP